MPGEKLALRDRAEPEADVLVRLAELFADDAQDRVPGHEGERDRAFALGREAHGDEDELQQQALEQRLDELRGIARDVAAPSIAAARREKSRPTTHRSAGPRVRR